MVYGKDCLEKDVYYALDIETGYPVRRFESYTDCINWCRLNVDDVYPVTNNFDIIIDW